MCPPAAFRASLAPQSSVLASRVLIRRSLAISTPTTTTTRIGARLAARSISSAATRASIPAGPIIQARPFTHTTRAMAATGEATEGVHNILSNEDWKQALADPSPMIVDCFAPWCGPCKVVAPVLEKLSHKYTGVRFYKIDTDEMADIAQELGVRALPTFYAFKDGERVESAMGANPKAIEALIQKVAPAA